MTGLFADWQPRYAERGIATFPVREKKPAVKGYLAIGPRASSQFARKFPADDAFGFACRRNRITILDVDAPDERLLADAMSEVGPSPFVVRSASGNFQAWYRNNGEGRRVRPDPRRPIDILGHGFVVAPPSRAAKGQYEIIAGGLDDLAVLPTMRRPELPQPSNDTAPLVEVGRRNDTLWRHCMARAHRCSNVTDLMEEAVRFNRTECYEPLPDEEVLRVVASAWTKEISGTNWFGRGGRVVFHTAEVDGILHADPDAFMLLTILRRRHWGRDFVIANAMAEIMPGGGWARKRFAAARQKLIALNIIEELRLPASTTGPPSSGLGWPQMTTNKKPYTFLLFSTLFHGGPRTTVSPKPPQLPNKSEARAARGDPDTSRRAAERVTPTLRQLQRDVLGFAAQRGDKGFTHMDFAKHLDCDRPTFRTRRSEFGKLGLIEDSKDRMSLRVRGSYAVWRITAAGLEMQKEAAND